MTKSNFKNDGMSEEDLIKERRYIRRLTQTLLASIHGGVEHTREVGMVQSLEEAVQKLNRGKPQ